MDWEALEAKTMTAPYIPVLKDDIDGKFANAQSLRERET